MIGVVITSMDKNIPVHNCKVIVQYGIKAAANHNDKDFMPHDVTEKSLKAPHQKSQNRLPASKADADQAGKTVEPYTSSSSIAEKITRVGAPSAVLGKVYRSMEDILLKLVMADMDEKMWNKIHK